MILFEPNLKGSIGYGLLASIILIHFECMSAHACTGNPGAPFPPYYPNTRNPNGPQSQLPQLMNADGSLNNPPQNNRQSPPSAPITPLTVPQPTKYPGAPEDPSGPVSTQSDGSTAKGLADRIHAVGEKISNLPDNIGQAAEEAGKQISTAFKQAGDMALNKLKESQGLFPDKFRSLFDNAVEIFSRSGNEKQRWDELVRTVDTTVGLSDVEKRDFYQRILSATTQIFR
ncbi:hypothetical protein Ddc_00712 [Ditylenchus destructor]|nr:hypothetical protein Ddc_00712 [Ditylenchus destructor]